jgi:hypothetical protein
MKEQVVPTVEKKLGQILLERNVISPTHLQKALDRQKNQNGKHRYIGEILLEMGIPQEKINEALDGFGKRKPMGQILLDLKVLTVDQLQKALEKQKQLARIGIRRPLGKLLVEMGYTSSENYLNALSKHFNMPIVNLSGFFPSPFRQRVIGEAYAQKYKILVLENDLSRIRIALAEPNPFIMDEIRRTFPPGKKVEFYLADLLEMDFCLKKKFDPFVVSHYR